MMMICLPYLRSSPGMIVWYADIPGHVRGNLLISPGHFPASLTDVTQISYENA
jgi:hypothetical protein